MQGCAGWRRVQGLERHPLPRVDQSQRRLCSYGMYGYGLRTDGRLDPKTYAYVVRTYIVMAYIVMVDTVMANTVLAGSASRYLRLCAYGI